MAIIITTITITSLVIKEEEVLEEEGIITTKVEDDLLKYSIFLKEWLRSKQSFKQRGKILLGIKSNKRSMLC